MENVAFCAFQEHDVMTKCFFRCEEGRRSRGAGAVSPSGAGQPDCWAERSRAAVRLSTGTGKRDVAFRLIGQHPETRFLRLAPSEYTDCAQRKSLRRSSPELTLANVTFCCASPRTD